MLIPAFTQAAGISDLPCVFVPFSLNKSARVKTVQKRQKREKMRAESFCLFDKKINSIKQFVELCLCTLRVHLIYCINQLGMA